MKDCGAYHKYIIDIYVIGLVTTDHLIGSFLGPYDLNVGMPVRREVGVEPVYEHAQISIDLMIDLFFGIRC